MNGIWSHLNEIKFFYPYLLLCPLLFLIKFFLPKKKKAAVLYGNTKIFSQSGKGLKAVIRTPLLNGLTLIFISLLSIAASRPHFTDQISKPAESRNLMLAIDLSGSMSTADFAANFGRISRLEAVKSVVSDFIEERKDDKIGLVVFGTNAFLQSPLTLDHELLLDMVRRLQVGIAGEDTAIGDGLGLSLKRIQDIEGSSKAIILVTDGVNRTGNVNPLKAAKIAKDLGIKIHTIGIGSKTPSSQNRFGLIFQSNQGAEFDEETLKKIADITGGVYHNASSLEGLKKVYNQIDQLEKTESENPDKLLVYELYPEFCYAALAAYLLLTLLSRSILLKVP